MGDVGEGGGTGRRFPGRKDFLAFKLCWSRVPPCELRVEVGIYMTFNEYSSRPSQNDKGLPGFLRIPVKGKWWRNHQSHIREVFERQGQNYTIARLKGGLLSYLFGFDCMSEFGTEGHMSEGYVV